MVLSEAEPRDAGVGTGGADLVPLANLSLSRDMWQRGAGGTSSRYPRMWAEPGTRNTGLTQTDTQLPCGPWMGPPCCQAQACSPRRTPGEGLALAPACLSSCFSLPPGAAEARQPTSAPGTPVLPVSGQLPLDEGSFCPPGSTRGLPGVEPSQGTAPKTTTAWVTAGYPKALRTHPKAEFVLSWRMDDPAGEAVCGLRKPSEPTPQRTRC